MVKPHQGIVPFEPDYRPAVVADGAHAVLQPSDDVLHPGEGGEAAELLEHTHCIRHHRRVLLSQRDVGDAVVRIVVCVVLVFLDDDGRVVTELVRAHHLDVPLDGAAADVLVPSLIFAQGIRAGVDEVLQRPLPVAVAETVVDGLVADKGVLTCRHWLKLLLNPLLN